MGKSTFRGARREAAALVASAAMAGVGAAGGCVPATPAVPPGVGAHWATALAGHKAASNTFYASAVNGNDSWSGRLPAPNSSHTDGPFKSLSRAQTAMRSSSTVKTVTIRAGTYSIAEANLSLGWQDTGELWLPYQNETAILDGGGSGYITGVGAGNITFEGLTFQNLGTDPNGVGGLHLDNSGHTIRWNTFLNCNTNCITGNSMSNSVIDSNIIDGSGPGGMRGALAFWYGSSNNQITHNLIRNSAEEGINISTGAGDPAASNNIIGRNILRNICSANSGGSGTDDCGAIYIYDTAHNGTRNRIISNIIDGNGGYTTDTTTLTDNWSKAIYLDGGTSNVTVSGNVCRGCGEYALQYHGGDHNTVTNNIFDLSSGGSEIGLYQSSAVDFGMTGNTFTNNIVYSANSFRNLLWSLGMGASDSSLADNTNLYYSAASGFIPNAVITDTNPQYANPQFTNTLAGDYTLSPNSPAYSLISWHTIPTDQGPLANPFISSPQQHQF